MGKWRVRVAVTTELVTADHFLPISFLPTYVSLLLHMLYVFSHQLSLSSRFVRPVPINS